MTTVFACTACRFLARFETVPPNCPLCMAVGTMLESVTPQSLPPMKQRGRVRPEPTRPKKIKDFPAESIPRIPMDPWGWSPAEKALPRGIMYFLSSEAGNGKSTFLLQSLSTVRGKVLFILSEESSYRSAARARRIGANDDMLILHTPSLFVALDWQRRIKPDVLVIDSVNMLNRGGENGESASLVDHAETLMRECSKLGTTCIAVSHINADGDMYGPERLKHISDANLRIDVDDQKDVRTIFAEKDRFGPTGPCARFRLTENGLDRLPLADTSKKVTPRRKVIEP